MNRGIEPRVNVAKDTMTYRLRDFVRMNPPIFIGSKVGEDPQEFLHDVYKVLSVVRVTYREKAELALYKLKDVSEIWYIKLKDNRLEESSPIDWE